jgi:hypothetical protein
MMERFDLASSRPACRAPFRAANNSAWRWPARWPPSRICCCSTNRFPRSMPRRASARAANCARCSSGAGVPSIVVTHDRIEAIALADWMAVMVEGRILQTGPVP